ncbi:hypothetical protein [Methanoplanus limicola]|uniref:Uncharacterized protein n=1 Tax=Methanoplanus limicola DSM 2279 TaxID=937775 RepID=H1YWZ0_9EURY|nr:hypothetical protein [Methanoplanus limicola]EHQ34913.1 hypothetical protein Metlim_0790 [Methanoplanus limicola DSM 2279]
MISMKRITVLLVFVMVLACGIAQAHMPGASDAPDTDLGPVVLLDGEVPVEITIDDIGAYHGKMSGAEPDVCVCGGCTYRALLCGINEIWGDEIPQRSDIGFSSGLVSDGALHCAWYITGTGPDMDEADAGTLTLLNPDRTVLTNCSKQARSKIAKERSTDNYYFEIERLSTGESVVLTVSEDVFTEGFHELRKKVKFSKNAGDEENEQFIADYSTVRDKFLLSPDYELFNEIEEKEDNSGVIPGAVFLCLIIVCCVGLFISAGKNK